MTDVSFVYVTVPDLEQAKTIGRCVVEEGFAACANIIPHVLSYSNWQGTVDETQEAILILKTSRHLFEQLEARIKGLHSYECPCIIEIAVTQGAADFLNWVHSSVRPS
ncbi:MAG: divalent-cation tolerance protein CutA [Bdellovibrionales bacterium]